MMSDLEKDILRTVLWFSLFAYPPTAFEVWKWMLRPSASRTLFDVVFALASSKELHTLLLEDEGVYVLRDSTTSSALRRERFGDAVRKMERVRRAVGYLKRIPFVRGVGVCNTLSWMQTTPESDIDLFIIVREGSLWTTRLLSVLPFKLLRARPGERVRDPFCFSFFLSDASLNLETLALPGGDPYLAYWTKSIIPVFDRDGVFEEFQRANAWTWDVLSQAHARGVVCDGSRARRAPDWLERTASKLQQRQFPETITQMANRDSRVVVSDAMLKFHANDRRELFRDRFADSCEIHHLSYDTT
ncbi:hypothetical protein A3D69_01405 [Candidatus Uhrbacteria bacterium RIFCSPHIGHO2_02_FULL_54_11]|nr:MAG: hypothetical protein UY79_C0004G0018 [Parcubacteria group bacterium GW2011_GWA2_53_21]OGL72119.1 MAG: hypothetical protein A3D69_01405 [Candidatus Uhrbacteria bacterium RIFCSPHIGHO2_02_FULL_54_11]